MGRKCLVRHLGRKLRQLVLCSKFFSHQVLIPNCRVLITPPIAPSLLTPSNVFLVRYIPDAELKKYFLYSKTCTINIHLSGSAFCPKLFPN